MEFYSLPNPNSGQRRTNNGAFYTREFNMALIPSFTRKLRLIADTKGSALHEEAPIWP